MKLLVIKPCILLTALVPLLSCVSRIDYQPPANHPARSDAPAATIAETPNPYAIQPVFKQGTPPPRQTVPHDHESQDDSPSQDMKQQSNPSDDGHADHHPHSNHEGGAR